MALSKVINLLSALVAITALSFASTTPEVDSYSRIPSKFFEVPEYASIQNREVPQLSLTLQIPREEEPIPFDTYIVPSTDLRAPDNDAYQGHYHPAPSQNLQAPSVDAWNPDNDPALLYELPNEITKEVIPTNLHPKKYDKAVFEKMKPVSFKPKEEVLLVPIKVQDYVNKQKQQDKTIISFSKQENQKLVQAEKVKQELLKPNKMSKSIPKNHKEPVHAATGFQSPIIDHAGHFDSSSLETQHHPSHGSGERVEFQMHGYDGPKSYKWGYDTGKGHNRQFRFEESNKDGYIKGHYGYYDKHGKLQMVHYDSHPHDGFHAEGIFEQ